jgi:hypothetical protein
MTAQLRPLSLGEILDRTAELYRNHFLLFAGIASFYAGVTLLLGLLQLGLQLLMGANSTSVQLRWVTPTFTLLELLCIFVFAGLAVAANNRAVAWVNLGEPATIRGAYRSILPNAARYLWLMIVAAFRVWAPVVLFFVVSLVSIFLIPGIRSSVGLKALVFGVTFLGILAGSIYAALMVLRYSLAVPACVVESLTAGRALKRSAELSEGSRGRIFVLGLLTAVINSGIVAITQSPFLILAIKHPGHPLTAGLQALQLILAFCTNTVIGPIYAIALTLFYYDQRIRKEGYDIEWMMQAAGLTALPEPADDSASVVDESAATQAEQA